MPAILLNHISVIMCPHGGMVTHIPSSGTSYRIEGQVPMLLGDLYQVSGCPMGGPNGSPCMMVTWLTASNMLIIRSQPALINTSVGMCMSATGVPQGPAVVTSVHSMQLEPESLTVIDD